MGLSGGGELTNCVLEHTATVGNCIPTVLTDNVEPVLLISLTHLVSSTAY